MPYKDKENQREWLMAHPDYHKKWNIAHPDERREILRRYYLIHSKERLEYVRRYYLAHPEKRREYARRQYLAHPEKRREYARQQDLICRAVKKRTSIGAINYEAVKVRDRMICCICGKNVVAKDLSFDHNVPLARGGTHTQGNIRVAHLRCNKARGAGRLPAQMILF